MYFLKLFIDLKNSLEKCELPFYWDSNLNLYEQIGESGLADMRRCVRSKTRLLENYARLKVKTEADHIKVYKTFCEYIKIIHLFFYINIQ